jgi:thioredoxin 1
MENPMKLALISIVLLATTVMAPAGEVRQEQDSGVTTPARDVQLAMDDLGLSYIPNIQRYRPIVGVKGMTIRWHLEQGARGENSPVPSCLLNTLTSSQMFWLHDYVHGYRTATVDEPPVALYQIYHFGAEWCDPCHRLKRVWASEKVVKKLAELKGEVFYLDADTPSHKNFFTYYNIRSYPTVVILKDGDVVFRFVGAKDSKALLKILQDYLK